MTNGNLPQEEALSEALDSALAELEAGSTPDEILMKQPDFASELGPFVLAAFLAMQHGVTTIPARAQHRSRTRMLVYAEKLRGRKRPRFGWPFFRRLALQLLAVLFVLTASLTGLAAASAQTIPGDQLYGIKRTVEDFQLNLAQPQQRGSLVQTFRERRQDEIRRVIADGRQIEVDFEGVVNQAGGTAWEIAGFPILLEDETSLLGEILPGMLVRVQGRTTTEGQILARGIQVVAYAFTGVLESRAGEVWVVAGVPVLVNPDTQVAPGVAIGTPVVVLAQVSQSGTISARAVLLADVLNSGGLPGTGTESGGSVLPGGASTPTPTGTPAPSATQTGTPTPTHTASPILATPDDDDETESPEPTEDEDDDDNSGSGSSNSGPGGGDDKTEEPDD